MKNINESLSTQKFQPIKMFNEINDQLQNQKNQNVNLPVINQMKL